MVHDRTAGRDKAGDPVARIRRGQKSGSVKGDHPLRSDGVSTHAEETEVADEKTPTQVRKPFAHLKQMEHNFGVQQISKSGRQQRRILQLDFTEMSIFIIAKGQRARTIPFAVVDDVDSDDEHPRFTLSIKPDGHRGMEEKGHMSYEFEAESFEEKNEIFHLLMLIVDENDAVARGDAMETEDTRGRSNTIAARSAKKPLIKQGLLEKKGHSMA